MQILYDTIGTHYSNYRRPDPRIATALNAELGQAASVVNIGAGVGSYEPRSYLNAGVRSAISTFSRVLDIDEGLRRLKEDLETGAWHNRYGRLFQTDSMDCGYRLVVWQREAA